MKEEAINRVQEAIDKKSESLAAKDENDFVMSVRRAFAVSHNQHIFGEVEKYLPDGFTRDHVEVVFTAMRKAIRDKAFSKRQDSELQNIRSMLDFMNQYQSLDESI